MHACSGDGSALIVHVILYIMIPTIEPLIKVYISTVEPLNKEHFGKYYKFVPYSLRKVVSSSSQRLSMNRNHREWQFLGPQTAPFSEGPFACPVRSV